MLKMSDWVIDPVRTLGHKLWLVDVIESVEYKDGQRTSNVTGYRNIVALPERSLEKISVRIDGVKQLEAPNGFVEVQFENLELYGYMSNGQPNISARATAIKVVNPKT